MSQQREKWIPLSDMRTFSNMEQALEFRLSSDRKRHQWTIGREYYAEIVGSAKSEIIESLKEYEKLKKKVGSKFIDLASGVFNGYTGNAVSFFKSMGKYIIESLQENDKLHIETEIYPKLRLIWKAYQNDGEIEYDAENDRLYLYDKLINNDYWPT